MTRKNTPQWTAEYNYEPTEFGIYVEIYLPKRARYQSVLFRTLTDGFNRKKVDNHFNDEDKDKINEIKKLLENYDPIKKFGELRRNFNKVFSNSNVYAGYTMYEVDGVFFDEESYAQALEENSAKNLEEDTDGADEDSKILSFIYEEKTQVIRLIFRPPINEVYNLLQASKKSKKEPGDEDKGIARTLVARYLRRRDTYSNVNMEARNPFDKSGVKPGVKSRQHQFVSEERILSKSMQNIVKYLENWITGVEFFVLGFFVFRFCEKVTSMLEKGKIKESQIEKEIWVSSFWNFNVTRIKGKAIDLGQSN